VSYHFETVSGTSKGDATHFKVAMATKNARYQWLILLLPARYARRLWRIGRCPAKPPQAEAAEIFSTHAELHRNGMPHVGAARTNSAPSSLTLQSVATYNAQLICVSCLMKEPLNVIHISTALETQTKTRSRVPETDENEGRAQSPGPPPQEGA